MSWTHDEFIGYIFDAIIYFIFNVIQTIWHTFWFGTQNLGKKYNIGTPTIIFQILLFIEIKWDKSSKICKFQPLFEWKNTVSNF